MSSASRFRKQIERLTKQRDDARHQIAQLHADHRHNGTAPCQCWVCGSELSSRQSRITRLTRELKEARAALAAYERDFPREDDK